MGKAYCTSLAPWQNGFAERLIGSIRREYVDHMIVPGEAHLRRILKSYADLSLICLPQSSACQRSLVEVRPTIPVCTLVGSVGLCVRLGLSGASNP